MGADQLQRKLPKNFANRGYYDSKWERLYTSEAFFKLDAGRSNVPLGSPDTLPMMGKSIRGMKPAV